MRRMTTIIVGMICLIGLITPFCCLPATKSPVKQPAPIRAQEASGWMAEKQSIIVNWNKCASSLNQEIEDSIWEKLEESLKADPPEHIKSVDRIAWEKQLIAGHKARITALEAMVRAEEK